MSTQLGAQREGMRQAGDREEAVVATLADNLSDDHVPRYPSACFFSHMAIALCSPSDIRMRGYLEGSEQ